MNIRKPPPLKSGDLVGVISPSWPAAALFPHRVRQGTAELERLGLRVRLGRNALRESGYTAGTPEERTADLHEMFADPEIKGIIAAIGGNHSNQLLPHINFPLIEANPKVFLGFSDITVLHLAIHVKAGLVTFYGPTFVTGIAEYPRMLSHTKTYLARALFQTEPIGALSPAEQWTDEFLDWARSKDTTRPRRLKRSKGWYWLRQGVARGPLLGGCLNSLMHLRGTEFWPQFSGALFFWELPEGGVRPEDVDAMLMDLDLSGCLSSIAGMIVGRPYRYNSKRWRELDAVILERTARFGFPIVCGVDVGHTDPVFTLPIGIAARLDSSTNEIAIDEAACTE